MNPRGQRWRLGCPHCGSVNWQVWNHNYTCSRCGETFDRLVDKKTGSLVSKPGGSE